MITATLPKRGQDAWGAGHFGAPRGSRTHKGIDYCCYPGAIIHSPVTGTVSKLGYPYGDDLSFRYVEVTVGKLRHRLFYVDPWVEVGQDVEIGSKIGVSQDISGRYRDESKPPMPNHAHYEILDPNGTPIDPEAHHE